MKIIITLLFLYLTGFAQQTVTDYDGNIYHTILIGDQTWLIENLKSLHYCDGTPIPEVVAYNNDDSLGAIYGLLYTWDAAMKGLTEPGVQGVCPCDWHVPTDEEWTILENYLGGPGVAGGKMKETGTEHWLSPNTGATNSSGFKILPGGEYDAYYNPNTFQLLSTHAVFWTSTQINQTKARERYLSYDNAASSIYDWYKVMKYSIRCIKDTVTTDIQNETGLINHYELFQNHPNPFNPITTIKYQIAEPSFVSIKVFDVIGNEIITLVNKKVSSGSQEVEFIASNLPSGVYFYQLIAVAPSTGLAQNFVKTNKMILMK